MCGGDIKNSLLRAATQAGLRADEEDRKVTMIDLTKACEARRTARDWRSKKSKNKVGNV
jgi:hypothetical protein